MRVMRRGVGRLGVQEYVEPRLRRCVADRLGVSEHELTPTVSLVDDLAADSLDVLELGLEVERRFGITLSESALDGVRTYGELVDLVVGAVVRDARLPRMAAESDVPPFVRTELVGGTRSGHVERSGPLTAYLAEELRADLRHAGPGAHLDVLLPTDTSERALVEAQDRLAALDAPDSRVSVRREGVRPVLPPSRRGLVA